VNAQIIDSGIKRLVGRRETGKDKKLVTKGVKNKKKNLKNTKKSKGVRKTTNRGNIEFEKKNSQKKGGGKIKVDSKVNSKVRQHPVEKGKRKPKGSQSRQSPLR